MVHYCQYIHVARDDTDPSALHQANAKHWGKQNGCRWTHEHAHPCIITTAGHLNLPKKQHAQMTACKLTLCIFSIVTASRAILYHSSGFTMTGSGSSAPTQMEWRQLGRVWGVQSSDLMASAWPEACWARREGKHALRRRFTGSQSLGSSVDLCSQACAVVGSVGRIQHCRVVFYQS